VSYQREDERYWTDYLRVALPIVGLLLLVGLLWFWLASIIGNDSENDPTPTPATSVTQIAAATSTATTQAVIDITATTGVPAGQPTATTGGEQPPPTNTPEGGEAPTEAPAEEARFAVDETVVTNDPNVNIRSEASSSGGDETVLFTIPDQGTELVITGESEVGDDDFTWWPVYYADQDLDGWVADDFIDPAE
jgi:hypothetical protein